MTGLNLLATTICMYYGILLFTSSPISHFFPISFIFSFLQASNFIQGIAELCHLDTGLAQYYWIQLLPSVWVMLSEAQQFVCSEFEQGELEIIQLFPDNKFMSFHCLELFCHYPYALTSVKSCLKVMLWRPTHRLFQSIPSSGIFVPFQSSIALSVFSSSRFHRNLAHSWEAACTSRSATLFQVQLIRYSKLFLDALHLFQFGRRSLKYPFN